MKKASLLLLIFFFLEFCSFFRSKIQPYPSGVFFPVEKAGEIVYEGEVIGSIEARGEKLYLSSSRGYVYCLNGLERRVLWKFEAGQPLASPPFCFGEKIYVYDQQSILYCLDKDGKELWKKKIEEAITSGVGESGNIIYFGTDKGRLFALNASSGKEQWGFQAGGAVRSTPVFIDTKIIFGCDDSNLYILTGEGSLLHQFKANDKIQSTPLAEKNFLYFGADDHYFYCFNLKKMRLKWKIKTGGKVSTAPVSDEKRVFFLCWNNVLYCLNKRNGSIVWWKIMPSRSFYPIEVSGSSIVVSSLSSVLLCFDMETGEKIGDFDAGQEVKSNPLWISPYLIYNLYDNQSDQGQLVFLKKVLKVTLTSSPESSQAVAKEVGFAASSTGFYRPKYEFYLKEGEVKKVMQAKSVKSSWVWFPEKEGEFIVGVEVTDEKQSLKEEMPFVIKKD
jgi:outer membrane protein assembly factor BamB